MEKHLHCKLLFFFTFIAIVACKNCEAQVTISGTVYDSTKLYVVPNVDVYSTSGAHTLTDSLGAYHISADEKDSISFFYKGKSTIKFSVRSMGNYADFDISLQVRTRDKYKLLKGITVFGNTYQHDSAENRQEYTKAFNYQKPGIHSSYEEGGAAGLDLDGLIEMFNKKKKRENVAFQRRLLEEEQDRYVDYRFSPQVIQRITGLKGDSLTRYRKLYMPTYEFVTGSSLTEFYQYILNTSYAFKKNEESLR